MAIFRTYGSGSLTATATSNYLWQVRTDPAFSNTRVRSVTFHAYPNNASVLYFRFRWTNTAGLFNGTTPGTQWDDGGANSPEWLTPPYVQPLIFNHGIWDATNGDTVPSNLLSIFQRPAYPGEHLTLDFPGDEAFMPSTVDFFSVRMSGSAGDGCDYTITCEV